MFIVVLVPSSFTTFFSGLIKIKQQITPNKTVMARNNRFQPYVFDGLICHKRANCKV